MALTLQQIARLVQGELAGDGAIEIRGLAKIEEAGPGELTFLSNPKYFKHLDTTRASAVLIPAGLDSPSDRAVIRTANPYLAFLLVLREFSPPKALLPPGIHPTAVLGESVRLGRGVALGAHVVVGNGCRIGDDTVLMPGVVLGDDVSVGSHCVIHAQVSIRERVRVGDRVVIHDGTVVGSDGFGFVFEGGVYQKIPQTGTVVIEDDVEIGANTAIDRATLGETRIRKGVKLDNLIQIAHNCTIGEHSAIAAQAGISGSTQVGRLVRIGGQAGFAGHTTVGDSAIVGAQSGIDKDVPPGVMVSGSPAQSHREELRRQAATRQVPELLKEIKRLRQRIEALEKEIKKAC
jgi:UDP-3-O-[3-hydroxymyristoyl] glucosamine N-acyltransferase